MGLPASLTGGVGTQGGVRGGSKVPFTNPVVQNIAAEIANDEKNHVIFLKNALGSQAVAEPVISLDSSFQALGQGGRHPGTFNPYADDTSFLLAAYVFEDVGATAYNGAAPFITSKAYLAPPRRSWPSRPTTLATIRTLLFAQQNGTVTGITGLISKLRATLSSAAGRPGHRRQREHARRRLPVPGQHHADRRQQPRLRPHAAPGAQRGLRRRRRVRRACSSRTAPNGGPGFGALVRGGRGLVGRCEGSSSLTASPVRRS